MYIGIIGGGISGLYCALQLSKKHKVILFDERSYIGGRIYTKNHLEMGAARFNDTHKILLSLIRKYELTPIKLPDEKEYRLIMEDVSVFKNIHIIFDSVIRDIIQKTTMNDSLRQITFFEHIEHILGNECEAELLLSLFGYYTEMKEINAYDGINTFKHDFSGKIYYVLKEGLSTLCEKMMESVIQNNSKICLNEQVLEVKHKTIITKKQQVSVDKIIFATKAHNLNSFPILKPIHKYFSCLYEAKLIRIYAKYKNVWFEDIPKTTTNNVLRQIIPIDKKNGIIMVSYSDGEDTKFFMENNKLKSEKKLRKIIHDNLSLLFPEKTIEEPVYIEPYLWEIGTHAWKPGCHSEHIYEIMLNPIKDIYICGEAYSKKQAWIEGGLCMANDILKKII